MIPYYFILFLTLLMILYTYRAVYVVSNDWNPTLKKAIRISYWVIISFVYITTAYLRINRHAHSENQFLMNYAVAGTITLSVTVLAVSLFQLLADLVLLIKRFVVKFQTKAKKLPGKEMPRRKFLNSFALGMGGFMLGSFLWGTTKGKYGWRILKNELAFDNLPKAFNGMRIVQISDLHLGSFKENFDPIREAVQMVNDLNPDYIFFTGDLVNESPDEAQSWVPVISELKAKYAKYAILGNHDYGWGRLTEEEKDQNSAGVAEVTERMGFKMLLNQHDIIEKDGDKIGLVGVENWGYSENGWFPTRGDYQKSVEGMEDVPFKILLSHDPTHWSHHIMGKEQVDLTLSGHTHGGQLGITIPGLLEISAGKLFYDRYAGLYKEGNQHLYINRGMGFLIFPGRVGMPPEITLHVLNTA